MAPKGDGKRRTITAKRVEQSAPGLPDFISLLKDFKDQNNFTLQQLADASGISISTLSRLENGQTEPKLSDLGKLAGMVGMTVPEMLQGYMVAQPARAFLYDVKAAMLWNEYMRLCDGKPDQDLLDRICFSIRQEINKCKHTREERSDYEIYGESAYPE